MKWSNLDVSHVLGVGWMGQADRRHIQTRSKTMRTSSSSGRIRRVELLRHGDAPMIEPGELMSSVVLASRRRPRSASMARGV
jgi:hypothetical protein